MSRGCDGWRNELSRVRSTMQKRSSKSTDTAVKPSAQREATHESSLRRRGLPPALIVALILFICYSFYFYAGLNWNIESRLSLTHAIVDDHTLTIDRYAHRTLDKAYYGGHYYCDKAVGASFLGVPVYWLYTRLTAASTSPFRSLWGNYLINISATVIPSVVAGVLLYMLLGFFTPAVAPRVWATLAYGLGTLAFPYSMMFFGHQTAAALVFIAFALLFRMKRKGWSPAGALGAGVLAGYALVTDFLSFPVVAGLGIYALITVYQARGGAKGQTLVALAPFVIGVLLPLPLQAWYNWQCFGSPFASAYRYEVLPEFVKGMSAGLMGITMPKIEPLFQLTLGPRRGIFYSSPFLLFAIPGMYLMIRRHALRLEGLICAGIFLVMLLMNAGYYLWTGGGAYGARFLIVAIPFLILPAFMAMPYAPRAFKILAGASMFFAYVVVITSPLIAESSPNPLFEGAFPTLFHRIFWPETNLTLNLLTPAGITDMRPALVPVGLVALLLMHLRSQERSSAAAEKKSGTGNSKGLHN